MNVKAKDDSTALMAAAFIGYAETVKFLIDAGADTDSQIGNGVLAGMNALSVAILGGSDETVKILLDNGADIEHRYRKYSMLEFACDNGKIKALLIQNGAKVYAKNKKCKKIKKLKKKLIKKSDLSFVKEIDPKFFYLSKIFNPNIKNMHENSNLYIERVLKPKTDIFNSNKINTPGVTGRTLLISACKEKNIPLIKKLIEHGADPNVVDSKGLSAWDYATKSDEILKILLEAEAKQKELHTPGRLVEILSNFTRDTPIKYTTHAWDFNLIDEYGGFDVFLKKIDQQWLEIKTDLQKLSVSLYEKIETFLHCWHEAEYLREWCQKGKEPLAHPEFRQIILDFKKQIEIRDDNDLTLEDIFENTEESFTTDHKIVYGKLRGKKFYTDTEKLQRALNIIFGQMTQRKPFEIAVEAVDTTGEYIDINIIHIGSFAHLDSKSMENEVLDGDFGSIKGLLTNLCDWCIENSYDGEHYRVHYLASNMLKKVESIDEQPRGFTHRLRFYK